ncbi:MAG: heavy metal-responsive transcriptional regulator [Gammaproteobacteria bacterium]|nr:heavy metal-responsive transcriptional regulator [Gammaproteobacteria bacterium]MDH5802271.1 heavy metal-responsive transcriptional regulator [Gammaproteobacteria bacterium]
MLRIGAVAKQTGLGIETVRFYEREGLISKPSRTSSGYRQYPETVVKQLRFIQHAKNLGFSLKEIAELISLKNSTESNCTGIKLAAQARLDDIQNKIDALERMKQSLLPLLQQCQSDKPISDCPILNNLDSN